MNGNWAARWVHRPRLAREAEAELRDHVERLVADLRAAGVPEGEARRRARLEFGGVEQLREECGDVRGTAWAEGILQDLRFGVRGLQRNPGFAASTILTVALAVGGATAVFSVVDRSLFRPLPYADDGRLVSVGMVAPMISPQDWMFAGVYQEWRRRAEALESMTAWKESGDCDRNDGAPERLACATADRDFLRVLGVTPALGRGFTEAEDRDGGEPVAMISHGLWRSRFGGGVDVAGKRMTIDGVPTVIVGVLPLGFEMPNLTAVDVLLPLRLREGAQRQRIVQVIGRLRDGVPVGGAEARLYPLFAGFAESVPADFRKSVGMRFRVAGLREHQTREYRQALLVLLGAVLTFVLMACANVANLLLARSQARRQEFAVRASLGASRGRLAQQSLIESLVPGLAGGVAGCLLAWVLIQIVPALAPGGALRIQQAEIDGRVLGFAMGLSLAASLLFGMAPAWERLRGSGRRRWWRPMLVAGQFSLSVLLLSVSGVFLASLWRLQRADLGYSPDRVAAASFLLPAQRYGTTERQIAFFGALEERLRKTPGVASAAVSDSLPPGGDPRSFPFVVLVGGGDVAEVKGIVKWRFVSADFLGALSIPLRRGRGFAAEDRTAGLQPVVLNETLARRLYGARDPVGKTLRWFEPCTVVGVAADVKNDGVEKPAGPEMYVQRREVPSGVWGNQRPPFGWRVATAVIRTKGNDAGAPESLREAIQALDPGLAAVATTMRGQLDGFTAKPKFHAVVLTLFALTGLLLAAVGLYGLTAFLAAERTREVGVRIALGATPGRIAGMMMRDSLRWTAVGIAVGLAASAAAVRGLRSVVYGAEAVEVGVVGAAVAVLAAVSLMGAWWPSARASRMDPMRALRQE